MLDSSIAHTWREEHHGNRTKTKNKKQEQEKGYRGGSSQLTETDRDKCSSIRQMSEDEGDKDVAAKASLSEARNEVRHKKKEQKPKETDRLPHNRINKAEEEAEIWSINCQKSLFLHSDDAAVHIINCQRFNISRCVCVCVSSHLALKGTCA